MTTAIIRSKGRITLPVDVRNALSVGTDDRVEFVQIEPGQFLLFAANRSVTELKGMFGTSRKTSTIDDMNRAIEAHAQPSHGRGRF